MSSVTTSASSRVATRASSTVVIEITPDGQHRACRGEGATSLVSRPRSRARGDVQAPAEQAGLDGVDLDGVGGDPVVVRLRVEGAKCVAMADAGGAPGGDRGEELSGDVLVVYDVEA